MDDFLHHYSIEGLIQEIYELLLYIANLTKKLPDRMMLRLGEVDIMNDLIQLTMLLVEFG